MSKTAELAGSRSDIASIPRRFHFGKHRSWIQDLSVPPKQEEEGQ